MAALFNSARYIIPYLLITLGLTSCGFVDSGGKGLNEPPSVSSTDLTANEQEIVTLDSSKFVSDDFGRIETYQWVQMAGKGVTLTGADQRIAKFKAPVVLQSEIEEILIFNLTVTDNFGKTDTGEISVKILPVNAQPLAVDDPGIATNEGTAVMIEVLANDSDEDGKIEPGTVVIATAPVNGSAAPDAKGIITYVHDGSETTSDSFTYTVEDNETGISNAATVSIAVNPVNDQPTISNIPNQETPLNIPPIPVGPIGFSVGDAETPAAALAVIATSSNQTLIPNANISLGGSGANRTITLTPAANASGTATITVIVADADGGAARDTFTLTVPNKPPNIGNISKQTTKEGTPKTVNFTVNDESPNTLVLSATSSNPSLLPNSNSNIRFGGSGRKRSITLIPVNGQSGNTDITITARDEGGLTDAETFTLTVVSNQPPTINNIGNQETGEGEPKTVNFTVNDESPNTLVPSATSSNPSLVPNSNSNISFGGSGTNRSITLTPVGGQTGSTAITVTVKDEEGLTATDTFTLTVTAAPNQPPKIGNIGNQETGEGEPKTVNFTVTDESPNTLVPSATSSNPLLVPNSNSNISFGGSGTDRSITLTPVGGQTGSAAITITVKDEEDLTDTATFTLQVTGLGDEAARANAYADCWTTPQEEVLTATLRVAKDSPLATYSILANGTKGSVSLIDPTTGAFEYVPEAVGARGEDSFVYQIDDPTNGVAEKTAKVVVVPKLMPLGDGITAGLMDGVEQLPEESMRVGYRKPLAEALTAAGYRFDLVGSQRPGAGVAGFDADAEAHVEWSALELAYGRVSGGSDGIFAWLQDNSADIVLLHTGSQGLNTSDVELILDEIDRWEASAQGHPVTVIVARIIDQEEPVNPEVSLFNANLEALVQNRIGDSTHPAYPDRLVLVDQHSALSYPGDLSDGLYPTAAGYANMARIWFEALIQNQLLHKCP